MGGKEKEPKTAPEPRGLQLTKLAIYLNFGVVAAVFAGTYFGRGDEGVGAAFAVIAVGNFILFARGLHRLR